MKRLIVNADDFGLTGRVNQAIIEGHTTGIITSASLMANGAGFESAVELSRRVPGLGVGIHLNITQGTPVSDPSLLPAIANGKGFRFSGPLSVAVMASAGGIRMDEVEHEFRAQIEKVLEAGITPTHIDGHKHVHALPPIFRTVIRLAREYRIRAVRCPAESPVPLAGLVSRNGSAALGILKQHAAGRLLSLASRRLRQELREGGFFVPSNFYGLTQTGFLDKISLQDLIVALPAGTSEIMCHPGYVDEDLRRTPTRLLKQREEELRAVKDPEIRDLVRSRGIELTNYRSPF